MHFDPRAEVQSLRRIPVNGQVGRTTVVTLPSGEEMAAEPEPTNSPKRKVQRYSPDRLLRRPLLLPGGLVVSAERHKGRIVVRVESPLDER